MKKIVALVLSLVMALSLCTVAFAAVKDVVYNLDGVHPDTDSVLYNGDQLTTWKAHTNKDGSGNIEYYEATWVETKNAIEYTKAGADSVYVLTYSDARDTELVADGYTMTKGADGLAELKPHKFTFNSYLIPCEQDVATCALYKNGSFNTWLKETDDPTDANYKTTAKVQKATTAKPNCTTSQFFEDGYLGADDCFYVDVAFVGMNPTALNVDGKIVLAYEACGDTDYVVWASHVFAKGVANDKTGYDVATCLICKGEFACTNDEAVATKNGYKISTGFTYKSAEAADVYDENKYENGYDFAWGQTYAGDYKFVWQLKAGTTEEIGTATKTETKTEGVESAKTFDAGIAMYVGMSLMSVAGTAVVIGKKKEF